MTEVRGGEPEVIAQVLQAAVGIAALHFPVRQQDGMTVVAVEHVQYLLDGHVDAWLDWPRLPLGQARQVTRMLRHARRNWPEARRWTPCSGRCC
jgi:hypothetical protein